MESLKLVKRPSAVGAKKHDKVFPGDLTYEYNQTGTNIHLHPFGEEGHFQTWTQGQFYKLATPPYLHALSGPSSGVITVILEKHIDTL